MTSARKTSWGVESGQGQRNVGVVNLYRIAESLGMGLSELFAEVESREGREGQVHRGG